MSNELCMNCFCVKGNEEICPHCGYQEGTPTEQPHYLRPGTLLANHFIVGTVIGVGGFGIIYRCYDATLGVIVAVKEFYPVGLVNRSPGETKVGLLSGDNKKKYEKQMSRFLMEAQSIAQFGKAKDIVNVYDYFEENNTAYIIMEYIDGILLQDYLEEHGKLEPEQAVSIINHIIEPVKKIHAQGIIHRDLSPDNIFIIGQDTVKIFDFGAAILNDSQEGTEAEKVVKMGYSAPEQYRESLGQGYYTDIYSIGALFYQMLTGKLPLEAPEREYKDELKSPLMLGAEIDLNLDRAVMEALAVNPQLRFQGIVPFEEAINGHRIACYPEVKIKRRKRHRNWTIALSVLMLLVIGVGIALYNTVLQKPNEMFEYNVPAGEKIVVWVDSPDMKQTLEQVINDIGNSGEGESENLSRIRKQSQSVQYQVIDITEEASEIEGYTCQNVTFGSNLTMDEALEAVKGTEEFPDVFLSDNVSAIEQYELLSYKDTVYEAVDSKKYLYLSQYETYFPDTKEMPISFDCVLFYALGIDEQNVNSVWASEEMQEKLSKRIQSSSLLGKQSADGVIALETILEANEQGEEFTCIDNDVAVRLALLCSEKGFDAQNGEFILDEKFSDELYKLLNNSQNAQTQEHSWNKTDDKKSEKMYGTSILAGAGYRSALYDARIGSSQIPYSVYIPTFEDKMLIEYTGKFAISNGNGSANTKDKQIAALRLIYFALGQQYYVGNSDTAYPLSNVTAKKSNGETTTNFQEYFESNPLQEPVHHLVTELHYPCFLFGKDTGELKPFALGMSQNMDASELASYCKNYKNTEVE